jgi:hypothetical protein
MAHRFSSVLGVGATLVLLAACDGTSEMIEGPGGQPQSVVSESEGIRPTLKTDKPEYDPGESVQPTFEVTNTTDAPRTFDLSSACQYDLLIRSSESLVWSFMSDQMCAQVLTSIELDPAEAWSTTYAWDQRANDGEPIEFGSYEASAIWTQTGKPLTSEPLTFSIR